MLSRARVVFAPLLVAVGAAACGGPARMPTGPAPDYEEPRAPSWMRDGGSSSSSSKTPAPGARDGRDPPALPDAPDAGAPAS